MASELEVGGVAVPDNGELQCGGSSDLRLYHNATNSYIKNATGGLYLGGDADILFTDAAFSSAKVTISSAGNVQVGGTVTTDAGSTTLGVTDSTTGRVLIQSTGAGGREYGMYTGTAGDLGFYDYTAGANRLTISSTGTATFSGLGVFASGIYFSSQTQTSATGAATTNNELNHYEQGTWTAELKGSTASATTPVTVLGGYTRIGNTVHAIAYFSNVNTTGATGNMQVSGLPFATSSTAALRGSGSVVTHGLSIPNKYVGVSMSASSTVVSFISPADDAAWSQISITAATGRYMHLTLTYFV